MEQVRDKTNKMVPAPSKDSDQPGHLPNLIRVFAMGMRKSRVFSYPLGGALMLRLLESSLDTHMSRDMRFPTMHEISNNAVF